MQPSSVTITSPGGLAFFEGKTQINGDVTINTTGPDWSKEADPETGKTPIQNLQEWAKAVTFIIGKLDITHADPVVENAIKFEALTSVITLEDKQPHVHYDKLTDASEITFTKEGAAKVETVRLPKITTTKFTGGNIDLSEAGTELHLDKFTHHKGNLSITLNGAGTTNLGALKELKGPKEAQLTLQLIGFNEVKLPKLTELKKLHVKDVGTLEAKSLRGTVAEVVISADVRSVDVGTAVTEDGKPLGAIKTLTFGAGTGEEKKRDEAEVNRDLEVLKVGGKATESTIQIKLPSGVEIAHIHGAKSVVAKSSALDEFVTAREINQLHLEGTSIRTLSDEDLVLGHSTDANDAYLKIVNNTLLESLSATNITKLNNLTITGNSILTNINFSTELKATLNTHVEIKDNDLIAERIELPITDKRDGRITDSSGLKTLKTFLGSKGITKSLVYFDGFKALSKTENTEDDDTSSKLYPIHRIAQGTAGDPATGATRVFVVTISDTNVITIGLSNTVYKTVELATGGSPANWIRQINKSDGEVKTFFSDNEVNISADIGGKPSGSIAFGSSFLASPTLTNDELDELDENAHVKLSIGGYAHELYLKGGPTEVKFKAPDSKGKGEIKTAKTRSHLVKSSGAGTAAIDDTVNGQTILADLLRAFPGRTADHSGDAANAETTRLVPLRTIPYLIDDGDATAVTPATIADGSTNITIHSYDPQSIKGTIEVEFTSNISYEDLGKIGFDVHNDGSAADNSGTADATKEAFADITNIKNEANTFTITLTSITRGEGEDDSTIGQPRDTSVGTADSDVDSDVGTDSKAWVRYGDATATVYVPELVIKGTATQNTAYPYWSEAPKKGKPKTDASKDNKPITDPVGWL